jgi:WD40 repeat protein
MRFILKNRQIAETAPLQLYSSALMFSPRCSITRELFKNELSHWLQIPRAEETWGAELQTLEGHYGSVSSVAFSPDGQLLASGSNDMTVKLWDPSTGELRQTLKGHSHWIWSGKDAIVSIENQQWICFQSQRILWLSTDYRVSCLAFKGSVLALGHTSGRISFISYKGHL